MSNIAESEMLKYAIEHGMIDIALVQEKIEMKRREELLEKHTYKIWQGTDGYWRTYLLNKEDKERKLIKKKTKIAVEDVIIDYWEEELENPTVEEVFNEWNDRKLELNKIVHSTHMKNIQIFNRHFVDFRNRRIKSIDEDEIENFLEEQIPKFNLTAKAFSNLKTVTRGFLKRAKKRKLVGFNVENIFQELDTSDREFKKVIKGDKQEVFDEVETDTIMNYLKENPDMMNLGILLMFVTGIRIGETVALKHSDFDGNVFSVSRTETRYSKLDGSYVCEIKEFPKTEAGIRTVIIPNDYTWLADKIKLTNPFGEFIFVKDGKRISTQSIRLRLKRLCAKLGIYHKSPHKIRKTYCSILLDNHIDNQIIIGQVGHTNISCTENHYHRNRKSLEHKESILSNIPEFKCG